MTVTAAAEGPASGTLRAEAGDVWQGTVVAPRLVTLVMSAAFGSYCAMALAWVVKREGTAGHTVVALGAGCVLLAMQLGYFSRLEPGRHGVRAYAMLLAQVTVAYLPLLYLGYSWVSLQAFTVGNVLLVLSGFWRWAGWAAVLASIGAIGAIYGEPPYGVVYLVFMSAQLGFIIYGLSWLRSLVRTLHAMRTALVRLSVAEERLRFGRDVHDLLGSGLSALTLKCELALRLTKRNPQRAEAEISHVLEISRRSLSDARSVAAGGHRLRLDEEIASARSVLAAGDVRLIVQGDGSGLPEPVQAAFATVLREGVTNVLRHASATQCTVVLRQTGSTGSIEIVNDRPKPGKPAPDGCSGSGLVSLTRRITSLSGTLTVKHQDDGTFLLAAVVPLKTSSKSRRRDDPKWDERHSAMLRYPRLLVWSTLGLSAVLGALWALGTVEGVRATMFALFCICAATVLQLSHYLDPRTALGSKRSLWVFAMLAVLGAAPVVLLQNPYLGMPGMLAGCILLTFRPVVAVPAFLAFMLGIGVMRGTAEWTVFDFVHGVVSTGSAGVVVYALTRLISIVNHAHAARRDLADLAVTEQRLRFEQDLQDMVGRGLSTIIMRGELAGKQCREEPEQAQEELRELLLVARRALADVRAVAADYREINLDTESSSARAILRSAGIEPVLSLGHGLLSQPVHTVLAMALREGVTNVLRYAEASRCDITVRSDADCASLEIVHDGATDEVPEFKGALKLRMRLAELDGGLTFERCPGGRVKLRATVPLAEIA